MPPDLHIVEVEEEKPAMYKVWVEIEAQNEYGDPMEDYDVSGALGFAASAEFDDEEEAMVFAGVLNEVGLALAKAFVGQFDKIPVDRWSEVASGFSNMLDALMVPFEKNQKEE